MKAFELKDVCFSYNEGLQALCGVSFDVHEGESLTIIGTNGSGKSTLLYLMDGLLKPQKGTIIGGKTACGCSLLFQNSQAQLFSLSVWDELCFGPLQLGLSDEEVKARAEEILSLLGIGHLRDRGPWDLSGGEMKKVAMGTCLSVRPDVFLLDEPTSGLDPRSQVEIADIIIKLKEEGKTIVTATHDLHMIEDISERTIVIGEDHAVMAEGKPSDILDDHELLLKANLIHKHPHKHDWYVHEHSHHGTHAHGGGATGPLPPTNETPQPVQGIDKLAVLLEHWQEHNAEHAATYIEWAEKAEATGHGPERNYVELARILREIADRTAALDELFRKAKKSL